MTIQLIVGLPGAVETTRAKGAKGAGGSRVQTRQSTGLSFVSGLGAHDVVDYRSLSPRHLDEFDVIFDEASSP